MLTEMECVQREEGLVGNIIRSVFAMLSFRQRWAIHLEMSVKWLELQDSMVGGEF